MGINIVNNGFEFFQMGQLEKKRNEKKPKFVLQDKQDKQDK